MPAFIDFYQIPSIIISVLFLGLFLHWFFINNFFVGLNRSLLFRVFFLRAFGTKK